MFNLATKEDIKELNERLDVLSKLFSVEFDQADAIRGYKPNLRFGFSDRLSMKDVATLLLALLKHSKLVVHTRKSSETKLVKSKRKK